MNIVCQIVCYVLKAELIINQPNVLRVIKVSLSVMEELLNIMEKFAKLAAWDVIYAPMTLMCVKLVKKVLSWMAMNALRKVFPFL